VGAVHLPFQETLVPTEDQDPVIHLRRLAGEIGARPGGSVANATAADAIAATMARNGYSVARQWFSCTGWEAGEISLSVEGQAIEAATNPFSPACDLRAPLCALGTMDQLEASDLRGQIAVLYGVLARGPLAVKDFPYKGEDEARLVSLLEEKGPTALLMVQDRPGRLERLTEDDGLRIPAATVPADAALPLLRHPAEARLVMKPRRWPAEACNVVGLRPGMRPERIILCAHFDSKVDTPGAQDNAAGVAALLALGAQFAAQQLNYGLELIAFNNEEYLPLGDDAYCRECETTLDTALAAINFDGIGAATGTNTVCAVSGSAAFTDWVLAIGREFPGVASVPPWPESNHSTFAWRGVPAVAFSNTQTARIHLREDTADQISADKLAEVMAYARMLVVGLQGHPAEWARGPQQ
jgi:Iap family predicted aminopeptidase